MFWVELMQINHCSSELKEQSLSQSESSTAGKNISRVKIETGLMMTWRFVRWRWFRRIYEEVWVDEQESFSRSAVVKFRQRLRSTAPSLGACSLKCSALSVTFSFTSMDSFLWPVKSLKAKLCFISINFNLINIHSPRSWSKVLNQVGPQWQRCANLTTLSSKKWVINCTPQWLRKWKRNNIIEYM